MKYAYIISAEHNPVFLLTWRIQMNTKLQYILAGTFALSLAAPLTSNAGTIAFTFDPTGNAGADPSKIIHNATVLDQSPGNALAVGGVTATQNFLEDSKDTNFTLYYQANLATINILNSDGDPEALWLNGSNDGKFFTFSAGFGETVTKADGVPGSATFGFDSTNPINYFTMYANTAPGSDLNGTGFTTGDVVLRAEVISIKSSGFTLTNENGVLLDQFNADNWSGQETVTGSGTTDMVLRILEVDSDYFLDLNPDDNIVTSFINTSQVDPFTSTNPAKCFNTESGVCDNGTGYAPNIGLLNGATGPDFLFLADANQAFETPEPASIALIGLGLALIGFFNRRRYVV